MFAFILISSGLRAPAQSSVALKSERNSDLIAVISDLSPLIFAFIMLSKAMMTTRLIAASVMAGIWDFSIPQNFVSSAMSIT